MRTHVRMSRGRRGRARGAFLRRLDRLAGVDRGEAGIRGPLGHLVVLVELAGLRALLAESEAGGLELADGVADVVEAGAAGRGQARRLLAAAEAHEHAVVAGLAERLERERAVHGLRPHELRRVAGEARARQLAGAGEG